MVNIKVNDIPVEVKEGTTILEACKQAKFNIPTLCYLKDINDIGACRVCVVEIKGIDRLVTSCNNVVKEGMEIYTNSPKVRESRRINIKMILSQHNCDCPTCPRSGNCQLQKIANDLESGIYDFKKKIPVNNWPKDFPLIRDESKCVKCMRCIQICDKIQSLNIWDIAKTGSRTTVNVSHGRNIKDADCALCGQCIIHCPTNALSSRDDKRPVFSQNGILSTRTKTTVVQVAPAVRTAWAESFNLNRKFATPARLAGALRAMGFDYVFDTTFSADLTIMEEGSELLERLKNPENYQWPMFTSCCPGWVRFLKSQYPEMTPCLSTAKSPQQMQGAIIKNYFADKIHEDPENIYSVSIMPCVAKKAECALPTMDSTGTGPDVDAVLNTREFINYLRSLNIDILDIPEDHFDSPIGDGTGAGVIFGATGGVMEAALRSAYYLTTGSNPEPDAFKNVRGLDGWKEATIELNGTELKVAIVSGLGNARKLIKAIKQGKVFYHFVEVMACPGGCVNGGGQPIHEGKEMADIRSKNLYFLDSTSEIRFSHENPDVLKVYDEYLEKPLSRLSHKLLHTDHDAWEMPLAPKKR
ncbi:MAG: [FeFe] hydrogenase, group A [Eubacteriales bacterium]|nr:[FeFe] hydrogenase, group A [Eubacteriales bacterium]